MCPRPVHQQAAPELKAAGASGPGVRPGGARGGPRRIGALGRGGSPAAGRTGRATRFLEPPWPWLSTPVAAAAWAGTSARSRYRRGPAVGRAGPPLSRRRAGCRGTRAPGTLGRAAGAPPSRASRGPGASSWPGPRNSQRGRPPPRSRGTHGYVAGKCPEGWG